MNYWRIKKRTFTEIIVSSLLGMIISMICVFYLLGKIITLNKIIDGLENREPIIITQIVNEEESQTEVTEVKEETQVTETKKDEKLKQNTSSGIKVQGKLEVDDRELLARLLYCEGRWREYRMSKGYYECYS